MAMRRQKVPSFIFYAVDSSCSLASTVTTPTLDAAESFAISLRGRGVAQAFRKAGLDTILSSKAPSIPKRKSSMDMSFRRVPSSSFAMDHQDSMLNARFDIVKNSKKNNTFSRFDRFVCLETITSPRSASRKTRASLNSDTPLAVPRRKPSQHNCSLSLNQSSSTQECNILSDLQNATFDN
ncbi:unnamed protein product [Cylindrotheca closterium]|uniref:Uncharacterized protein n=1 Tax=Cylindrotheca closterium TaxID=2856 RepID=A0AAD2G3A9_9STRA|nr:unnamed protein product [Cylindrotheca closterium]